jgi:hypothetical protein
MHQQKAKKIIGQAEQVKLSSLGTVGVHARIDTGARTSAIWASKIVDEGEQLGVVFFGEGSPLYTGEMHYFEDFERVMVASSNGQAEERYKIKLPVTLAGRKIRARFTLADRSMQVYPVLIGRNVLRGKFIVDVSQGTPLRSEEKRRSEQLQSEINDSDRRNV